MSLSQEEVQKRIPLWLAISQLYIDNEVGEYDFNRIVGEILKNDFSFDEAEKILIEEVAPVCCWNLYATAGVWTAFDEEDLVNKILKNIYKQEVFPPYHWYIASVYSKFLTAKMIWEDWEKVRAIYQERKSQNFETL